MTREDKRAYNYARDRLANDDYPVYSDEYELELAYKAGIEDAKNHPRWISVEDELPPKKTGEASDNVLVYDAENNRVGASWYIHSTGKWFNGWDSITHWMPMPSIETIINKQL